MEVEVRDCIENKIDEATVPDSCFDTGEFKTSEELFWESLLDSSLSDTDSNFDCTDASLQIKQKMSLSPDLKSTLMQRLKTIREIDYSIQFCNLLIQAENLSWNDVELNHITEKFLNDLKEIDNGNINIAKIFLQVLQPFESNKTHSSKFESLTSFFDLIRNSNCNYKISSENLINISKTVKELMELFCNEELYHYYSGAFVEKPEKTLQMLEKFLFQFGSYEGYSVLYKMYLIGRDNLSFSEKEKSEITSLLIIAAKYIEKYIRDLLCYYRSRLGMFDLQMRSSLQFITHYFDDLTDENAKHKIQSSKKLLDDLIARFCASYKPSVKRSYCIDDSDEDEDDFIKKEFNKMPKEHYWWGNYQNLL